METQNKIVAICAPSGSGKTTIYRGVMATLPVLSASISATTRDPRGTEKNGVDYYFFTHEEFMQKAQANEFAEYEEVYDNKFYGTLKSEISRINALGQIPLLDVDVKGAQSIKNIYGEYALLIFVKTPPLVIKERLEKRGTDNPEDIAKRLARIPEELTYEDKCDVVIENIDLEKAITECRKCIVDFLEISY